MLSRLLDTISTILSQFSSKEVEWESFSSPEGKFSVLLPGKPVQRTRQGDVEGNPLVLQGVSAREKGIEYGVAYADYPEATIQEKGPEAILDDGNNAGAAIVRGQFNRSIEVNRSIISINGYPGRAQRIETGFYIYQSHTFLVNNRFYMVIVSSPKSRFSSEKAQIFLESFQLVQ